MTIRSSRSRAALVVLPALLVGGLLLPSAAGAPAAPAAPEGGGPPPKINLVLDLSGSMKADDAGGKTRLDAAKQAIGRVIDTAPEDAPLGLRVYGASYPGEDKAQGCADTRQLFPVGTMDAAARANAKQQVEGLDAVGFTPIGVALRAAAGDVGTEGKRRIILVSDGEDTCAPPPPCDVARELKAAGIDLTIDTVGFKTTGTARDQLKCIATTTGGSYADADNADALTANLSTLFRRAWTTYQVTGTPVKASTNGCADAPLIGPGQYMDAISYGVKQYYRVKKTPQQLLQVSATVALTPSIQHSNIEILAGPTTPSGDPKGWMRAFSQSTGWANVLSTGGRTEAPKDGETPIAAANDEGCIVLEGFVSDPVEKRFPLELVIGLADADPAKQAAAPTPPAPETGADTVGGVSFNSATPIGPGTYRQSIAIGESPVWRVDLKAGQRLTLKGGVEVPADLPYQPNSGFGIYVFNPLRERAECSRDHGSVEIIGSKYGRIEKTCDTWEIAQPNDSRTETAGYSVPGTYYIQVGVGSVPKEALGLVVPVDLTVTVDGTPRETPAPVFDFGGNTAAATSTGKTGAPGSVGKGQEGAEGTDLSGRNASSEDDKSTVSKLALPVGIVAGIALLGGAGYYGLRRR